MKKVTIRDVAEKAGVSISIVSFALNNVQGRVSSEVKEKVLACAKELGYVPNTFARHLRNNQCNTIALVYPQYHFEEKNSGTLQLVAETCKWAKKKHKDVLIKLISEQDDWKSVERECIELSASKKVDGIILYCDLPQERFWENLKKRQVNFVYISETKNISGFNIVYLDNYRMMYDGISYIHEKGYEEIYYLTYKGERPHDREMGFRAVISALDITGDVLYYENRYRQKQDIWSIIHSIVEGRKRRIAIACWNDVDAVNVIELLQLHGIKIPEEVGVMGVDDLPVAEHIQPALTTIKQPFDEIARIAVDILSHEVNERQSDIASEVTGMIIKRNSI